MANSVINDSYEVMIQNVCNLFDQVYGNKPANSMAWYVMKASASVLMKSAYEMIRLAHMDPGYGTQPYMLRMYRLITAVAIYNLYVAQVEGQPIPDEMVQRVILGLYYFFQYNPASWKDKPLK